MMVRTASLPLFTYLKRAIELFIQQFYIDLLYDLVILLSIRNYKVNQQGILLRLGRVRL